MMRRAGGLALSWLSLATQGAGTPPPLLSFHLREIHRPIQAGDRPGVKKNLTSDIGTCGLFKVTSTLRCEVNTTKPTKSEIREFLEGIKNKITGQQEFSDKEVEEYVGLLKKQRITTIEQLKNKTYEMLRDCGLPVGAAHIIYEKLNTLISIGKQHGFKEKETNSADWFFSHPFPLDYDQGVLEALQTSFKKGVADVRSSLEAVVHHQDSKGPVILAIQSGIGIGKSHACDHAAELCFPGIKAEDVLVVKVSYNFKQGLVKERSGNAEQGLLARMWMDLNLNIDDGLKVERVLVDFLDRKGSLLNVDQVTDCILSKTPKAFILAIDEVGKLADGQQQDSARQVLSTACACLQELFRKDSSIRSAILVTALPSLNFRSLSERRPCYISLRPASDKVAREVFLKAVEVERKRMNQKRMATGRQRKPTAIKEEFIKMALLIAGGHYRTLVAYGQLIARKPLQLPSLELVAERSTYEKTPLDPEAYLKAIIEQYSGNKRPLEELSNAQGVVFQDAIVPLCMLRAVLELKEREELEGRADTPLTHLDSMLLPPEAGLSAAKALEHHFEHWDAFRAANGLSVIPREFWNRHNLPSDLKYQFADKHLKEHWKSEMILHQHGGIHPEFIHTEIDEQYFYVPEAEKNNSNHRAFESMAVAKAGDGTKYLVLYQSKIGGMGASLTKLDAAAKDLSSETPYYEHKGEVFKCVIKGGIPCLHAEHQGLQPRPKIKHAPAKWTGKFLFIISALDQKKVPEKVNHPTLFVTDASLNAYFTPTLAQGARRWRGLH